MFALGKFASDTVSPRQGDVFVLFTDGLLEVTNKSGAEFELERITAVLSSRQHETLRALDNKILQAARGFGRTDDDESMAGGEMLISSYHGRRGPPLHWRFYFAHPELSAVLRVSQ